MAWFVPDPSAGTGENVLKADRLLSATAAEPFAGLDNVLIVHVSSADAFALAHIPGAALVTPAELVCGIPPAPGKLPPEADIAALLQRIGYAPHADIVVYDDEGGGWAGRFIWTLEVIGHERWYYLDGGLHAWAAAGKPFDTGPATLPPVPAPAPDLHYDSRRIADLSELLETFDNGELTIWDARSRAEHVGDRSGSARAGRIPGSRHLDWLELMDHDRHLCLRADLAALLAARGIRPARPLVVHCQTHHRSGLAYLAARLLGWDDVKAYDGSWAEWGNRDDTPIERGAPHP